MSLSIGYPTAQGEVEILERNQHGDPVLEPVLDGDRVQEMRLQVRDVEVSRPVREYIRNILAATREHPEISLGASPRAGVQLQRAAQSLAAFGKSPFVAPEHVKTVAPLVLGHRIVLSPSSSMSTQDVVQEIVRAVPVPL
jgi:MoxR-like ATPase